MKQNLTFRSEPFCRPLTTIAALSGERFNFEFESPFGKSGNSFQIFESLDYEAMAGSIPERDYLRWVQFSLNMYFKKSGLRGPIAENGKDSVALRDALQLFNAKTTGRKKYRDIDERTQNALILANEHNTGYLAWLRTQLDLLGLAGLTTRYTPTEKPTLAIKAFQRIWNGHPVVGFALKIDGFVGAKTHLAILRAIHALKPPKPKPPKPPEACKLCDMILIAPVDELAANDAEVSRLRCLRKFLADALSGKKLDDRYWTYPFETYLGQILPCSFVGQKNTVGISFKNKKMKSALQVFKHKTGSSPDKKNIAQAIKAIHDDILCQINSLSYTIAVALGDLSERWETLECVEARMLQRLSVNKRPESVFKCFRDLLGKHFSEVCKIPL